MGEEESPPTLPTHKVSYGVFLGNSAPSFRAALKQCLSGDQMMVYDVYRRKADVPISARAENNPKAGLLSKPIKKRSDR